MIITRTPHRLSLVGGGSDIPSCIREMGGGLVVGGAVSLFSYLSVRPLPPFHAYKSRIVYGEIELVASHRDIRHKAVKACLEAAGVGEGVEVFHQSDVPARSGTGSSSTFVVGLLNALHALGGSLRTPDELALEAIRIEREVLRENVGCQDQIFASLPGGPGQVRFHADGTYTFVPLALPADHQADLESRLLLYFTGISRTSSEVAGTYYDKLAQTPARHHALVALAEDATDAIRRADYERLGKVVDASWRLKAGMGPAVCPEQVSDLYMRARLAGAWGGKLCGAGGGGSLLLVAPPEAHGAVHEVMAAAGCVRLPFRFTPMGSHVVFADRSLRTP